MPTNPYEPPKGEGEPQGNGSALGCILSLVIAAMVFALWFGWSWYQFFVAEPS